MNYYTLRHVVLLLLLLAFCVVFPQSVRAAGEREMRIHLSGNLLPSAPPYVTVPMLEKLNLTEYMTYNPYDKKGHTYKGVLLKNLVKLYARPDTVKMKLTAIDEYTVEFSKSEWERWDIMLATQCDGKHLGVKESGPAKIVMPYATAKDINHVIYNLKWIWLVNNIRFMGK
jgi:hypothetical protein